MNEKIEIKQGSLNLRFGETSISDFANENCIGILATSRGTSEAVLELRLERKSKSDIFLTEVLNKNDEMYGLSNFLNGELSADNNVYKISTGVISNNPDIGNNKFVAWKFNCNVELKK